MIGLGSVAALNHVLLQQHWALERLRPFAGKTVELRSGPLPSLSVEVLASGLLEVSRAASADLTATVRPALWPRLLLREQKAIYEIDFAGPAELAVVVQDLYRQLEWDIEEDLSHLFGDVLAHRMASAGRELAEWPKEAGLRLAQNITEYWTEEKPVLARPADMKAFVREVESVREQCAALEQRIAQLEASRPR